MDKVKKAVHAMGTVILIYSILVFAGGVMGFIMKNSLPSLLGGGIFGLTLVLMSVMTFTLRKWGLYVSFALILLLDAFFSYRFVLSYKFFPSGLMLAVSTLTLVILMVQLQKLSSLSKSTTLQK